MEGTVLVVEDAPEVRELVRVLLERAGLQIAEAPDGRTAIKLLFDRRPDAVVLDVGLPELDGWTVLERIREVSSVPVLMLTAEDTELDKVRALRGGADDYVTKPFGRAELVARVEALLRRARATPTEATEVHDDGCVRIDFGEHRASAGGTDLELTPLEFRLLAVFARHPGQLLSHDKLLELVWSDTGVDGRDRVKLYVGYLRRKLSDAAGIAPIETVRGMGYRYRP